MQTALDHLVVAAAGLDAGAAWLEAHLGVPLAPGGKHAAMGTHNRLLKLGASFSTGPPPIPPRRLPRTGAGSVSTIRPCGKKSLRARA